MRPTDMTLLEQLRVTDLDLETRKTLYGLTDADVARLASVRGLVETRLDDVVARFYEAQTAVPEIALLIGDADTLVRLRNAQRRYLDGLFSGSYNLEYVNNRLRIGLVHKRIGVDPKLYLAAVHTLTTLLADDLLAAIPDREEAEAVLASLRKLVMFDVALVFETYIRSLVTEIENSKQRSEAYAR
ncbi:MAG: protoglobin domain-containing protein, partial [Mycobacteriales bacterium]